MLLVRDISVRFVSAQVLEVTWQIEDTFEDVTDYRFIVQRSEAPEGPYTNISPELNDAYVFHDVSVNLHSRNRETYYRVRVKKVADSSTQDYGSMDPHKVLNDGSPPGGVALEAAPDLVALEVRRLKELELKEFTGRRCLWFPRRTFGRRCSCIDTLTKKATLDNCRECYGSHYAGGFLYPVELWVQIGAQSEEQDMLTWMGKLQPGQTQARTVTTYRLKPGDMVVEAEGTRWLVDRVRPREKLRSRVHADYVLSKLPRSNVEYELQVDWSKTSLAASPARTFLPCTDVESFRAEAARRGLTTT